MTYNCRKCLVRNRCIDESDNPLKIKSTFYHAFNTRTDTMATWARLQENCLLNKAKNRTSPLRKNPERRTALRRRIEQVQQTQHVGSGQLIARTNSYIGRAEFDAYYAKTKRSSTEIEQPPNPHLQQKHYTTLLQPPSTSELAVQTQSCWLTIDGTWRHISLPANGTLVFGHFDPGIGIPPDIDLTYEDQDTRLISRRHAIIAGKNGVHTIEDLGSASGVFLNGEKIVSTPSRGIEIGDRIRLGNIHFTYDNIPDVVLRSVTNKEIHHTLTVTASREKIVLNPPKSAIIGRSDAQINYTPDVDLSSYGKLSQRVSRRHARIQWRSGRPYLEDMGSGFGTRLRGGMLPIGEFVPLLPGDHIWLAGCVLAYDVEVPDEEDAKILAQSLRVITPQEQEVK